MDRADYGAARDGIGAAAGSARGGVAGLGARRFDERDAIFVERWKPVRRRGCGGGSGQREFVGGARRVAFENYLDARNFSAKREDGVGKPDFGGGHVVG